MELVVTTPSSSLIAVIRRTLHELAASEPQAWEALDKVENALQAAYELTDGFVMQRVGPRNYGAFYKVRTLLSEALGRDK